jgi:hypothetical protein
MRLGLKVLIILMALLLGLFAVRLLRRDHITLRSGREVPFLAAIAMLDGEKCSLLSFDYESALPPTDPALRVEAGEFLQVAAADKKYRACRMATVTARAPGEGTTNAPSPDRVYTFRRGSEGDWQAIDR